MRAVVVDAIAAEGLAYLRERGFEIEQLSKPSAATLAHALADAEALVTRSSTAVTAALLDSAPRLRIVGRAGVGIDNIDVDACSRRGVVVVNAPYGNVVSAAEHTMGMLLALVRRIPEAHARLKTLEWDRSLYGAELFRKTVGVVGLGKVGSRVAARLRPFECELLVHDPYVAESRARDVGARLVDFDMLLARCDVITFHIPLTPETDRHGAGAAARAHEGGCPPRQLCAGRHHQRGRSPGGAECRARGGRRHRRVERGAAHR